MAQQYYFPTRDEHLDEWVENFITQLATVASGLGIENQEVTDATTLKDNFKQAMNDIVTKDAEKRQAVGRKNNNKKILAAFIRPLIQRIKNHPDYSPTEHGTILRIIGPEEVIDLSSLKPVLKAGLDADRPKIIWQKGPVDGIIIWVDRNDGRGFKFLTIDTKPDYVDTFPVPEDKDSVVWKYKGRYIIDDKEVGHESEVVSITVTKTGED